MDVLVVMDPLDGCDPRVDSSIALMRAALERGHGVRCTTAGGLSLVGGRLLASARAVSADGAGLGAGAVEWVAVADADVVLVRTDPPVDPAYLAMTLLLEHVRDRTLVVNDPRGLREANEKLYACRFPDLMPTTVVSADRSLLLGFADEHGGAVLKPLDGHGGRGVQLVRAADPGAAAVVDRATDSGRVPVMAQEFLAAVARGDRRILVLDGEPLGALLRVPAPGEFRANIGLGARVDVVGLDDRDRRIVEVLAPALRADGLWFVGIDVIDGRLSEVNVTSPTGLRQLADLSGTRPDLEVMAWLEARAPVRR
jgi:glutathione synthase